MVGVKYTAMTEKYVQVQARYEESIRIKHLAIEPSLQGATIRFPFGGRDIEIKLPVLPTTDKRDLDHERIEAEADVWDRKGNIIRVYIYTVRVAIVGLKFRLPIAAATHRGVNATLYSDAEIKCLDKESDRLYALGRRAVDYWLRVVRWKTGLGLIDIDVRPSGASARGGSLINAAHGGRFYTPRVGRVVVVPKTHLLDAITWSQIDSAVAAGAPPPIWNEYLTSAERRIKQGDLRAAVIDLAVAAESAILLYRETNYPARRSEFAKQKISDVFRKWTRCGLPPAEHHAWFANVERLFDVRNGLMHRGDDASADISFCHQAFRAVSNLIALLA